MCRVSLGLLTAAPLHRVLFNQIKKALKLLHLWDSSNIFIENWRNFHRKYTIMTKNDKAQVPPQENYKTSAYIMKLSEIYILYVVMILGIIESLQNNKYRKHN